MISTAHKSFLIKHQTIHLYGELGDIVSVSGFAKATMITEGLTYTIEKHPLSLEKKNSASN